MEKLPGAKIPVVRGDWRPGDQRVFYADIRKAEKPVITHKSFHVTLSDRRIIFLEMWVIIREKELGWKPQINVEEGVRKLFEWVKENKNLF